MQPVLQKRLVSVIRLAFYRSFKSLILHAIETITNFIIMIIIIIIILMMMMIMIMVMMMMMMMMMMMLMMMMSRSKALKYYFVHS